MLYKKIVLTAALLLALVAPGATFADTSNNTKASRTPSEIALKPAKLALIKFLKIKPILNEAGFSVTELRWRMKLIPKIEVYITQHRKLTKAQQKAFSKQYKGHLFLQSILKVLFFAYSLELSNDLAFSETLLELPSFKTTLIFH